MNTTPPRDLLDRLAMLEAAERLGVRFCAEPDGEIRVEGDDRDAVRFLREHRRDAIDQFYWPWRALQTLIAVERVTDAATADELQRRFNDVAALRGHELAFGELVTICVHWGLPTCFPRTDSP